MNCVFIVFMVLTHILAFVYGMAAMAQIKAMQHYLRVPPPPVPPPPPISKG